MQTTANVNYHVTTPGEQAFYIDANGETGNLVSPALDRRSVQVTDLRNSVDAVAFFRDSVCFVDSKTAVESFSEADNWREPYDRQLTDLLAREIGAKESIIFDHTVRIDSETSGRKPARNVHGDYSARGAHQRLRDILGEERAAEWETGHFGFVNAWRPIGNPIVSAPLGFVRPRSVRPEDWIDIDLVYPDRKGHILGLVENRSHEWIYLSRMTPDEIAFFNVYDNGGLSSIAHSALDLVEDAATRTPRASIESRTLVRY